MNTATFVQAARSFIGTPFHHQGRLPQVGLDCAGVVVCALRKIGAPVSDVAGYGRVPSQGIFEDAVMAQCEPVPLAELRIGDLMMFAFRTEPQHIAIVSSVDPTLIIHAYESVGRVVENSFDTTWQKRLRGCYRIRGA